MTREQEGLITKVTSFSSLVISYMRTIQKYLIVYSYAKSLLHNHFNIYHFDYFSTTYSMARSYYRQEKYP